MKIIPLLLILLLSSCATTKTTWAYGRGDGGYSRYVESDKPSKFTSQTSTKIDSTQATLTVEVFDKQHKESVPFANVVIYKNKIQIDVGTTDMDGNITFKQLPAGTYQIKAIYIGYYPASGSIIIENGNAYKIKLELEEGRRL